MRFFNITYEQILTIKNIIMNWKNLKLRTKLFLAFGLILGFLAITAIWATSGISNIIDNGEEVIAGNKLRNEITLRNLDHVKWVNEVNAYISNDDVTSLHVETDHHNCKFGKWYYGEGRKNAEKILPQLKILFDNIENPHTELHRSAIEIQEVFEQADKNLSILLLQARGDHMEWMVLLGEAINLKKNNVDIIVDHRECNFGKWLHSQEAKDMIQKHPEYASLFSQIEEPHQKLHASAKVINNHLAAGNFDSALKHFTKETHSHDDKILHLIDELVKLNNDKLNKMQIASDIYNNKTIPKLKEVNDLFEQINRTTAANIMTDDAMISEAQKTKTGVIILVISIIIIAFIVVYFITNSIVNPIKKGVDFAEKISKGDLTGRMDINQDDEMGQLANALNGMVTTLKNIIENVKNGSFQISSASNELSTSSQEMSQGSNETASTAEEVSSTMEQMQANIEQNAQNAKTTEDISAKAATDIETGSKAVIETVNSMKIIAEKITIINEIAFQTNILALNAAVEAARAGDEGKGFAVVAGEVKSLAERSRDAAEEIDKIAANSVAVAENSGSMLAAIVPDIIKTAQLVKEISVSSAEQNLSATQVANAIDQLNRVTQQSSAVSEEVASSAEELASQAEHLKMAISFFKVNNNTYDQQEMQNAQQYQPKTKIIQDGGYNMDLANNISDNEFEKY